MLLPFGWSIRNYVHTGFLERLGRRCDVIAALRVCEEPLVGQIRERGAQVLELPDGRTGRFAHGMEVLLSLAHEHRRPHVAHRARRSRLLRGGPIVHRLALGAADRLAWLVARVAFGTAVHLESRLALASLRTSASARLLETSRPAIVFSTAPFRPSDIAVARLARADGIPTAAAVLSWDNPASKSRMPPLFDRYFVWSEQMAKDLLGAYPDIEASRVQVTGTPQFDSHAMGDGLSRDAFCEAMGLDRDRPIVTYTASTERLVPGQAWIVEKLCDALDDGRLPGRPQILVRAHPLDDGAAFHPLERRGVRNSRPWALHPTDPSWGQPTARDLELLVATLRHSAVNVNCFSTMTLDFALFDTPIVNVAFDTPACRAAGVDVPLYYRYAHYQPVREEGAVRFAHSPDELVDQVAAYLREAGLDVAGRRRLVERLCGPRDGRAAERIAEGLADMAGAPPT